MCPRVVYTGDVYHRGKRYSGRYKKSVRVTNNMGALLHYILTSISFDKSGHFMFTPDPTTQKLLDTFTYYDVVDTYQQLGLNLGLYGASLVDTSREYVSHKLSREYIHDYRKHTKTTNQKKQKEEDPK